jgi:glycerol-3-phosphate dehydrogenase
MRTTSESVDVLVIGGGINGAGIARDAAGRGLKVALVEQSDLGCATSSSSTKLVHGGLRYLESFAFRLVRESLAERERLLSIAPHIVRPMEFILPHAHGLRPRWQIALGLLLYDRLGARRRLAPSRAVRLSEASYGESLVEGVRHGFSYSDCTVDDSRLVILNAMDAASRGASIRTRTRFVSAQRTEAKWAITCVDERTGQPVSFDARAIVNATGPWMSRIDRCLLPFHTESRIRLVKGSHIVVPRLYSGEHAFLLQHTDGRVVFTIPYENKFTLIGTTDVPYNGDPNAAEISSDEVNYLCAASNRYFRAAITPSMIEWSFAGIRPLIDDDSADASKVTRDYRLDLKSVDPVLLSVLGGKLTTYRKLAEKVGSMLQTKLGGSRHNWTASATLPGGDLPQADLSAFVADAKRRWSFLPDSLAARLARTYGTRMETILGGARNLQALGEDLGAGLTQAELQYLVTQEWACTTEDILWRRTKLGLRLQPPERAKVERSLDEALRCFDEAHARRSEYVH